MQRLKFNQNKVFVDKLNRYAQLRPRSSIALTYLKRSAAAIFPTLMVINCAVGENLGWAVLLALPLGSLLSIPAAAAGMGVKFIRAGIREHRIVNELGALDGRQAASALSQMADVAAREKLLEKSPSEFSIRPELERILSAPENAKPKHIFAPPQIPLPGPARPPINIPQLVNVGNRTEVFRFLGEVEGRIRGSGFTSREKAEVLRKIAEISAQHSQDEEISRRCDGIIG